jgi:hypothetical protein
VCTRSGEPSGVQILAYFLADWLGRVVSTKAYRIGSHSVRGISITRGSERNCLRYRLTARGVGESGVPRLMSRTADLACVPCRDCGSVR